MKINWKQAWKETKALSQDLHEVTKKGVQEFNQAMSEEEKDFGGALKSVGQDLKELGQKAQECEEFKKAASVVAISVVAVGLAEVAAESMALSGAGESDIGSNHTGYSSEYSAGGAGGYGSYASGNGESYFSIDGMSVKLSDK